MMAGTTPSSSSVLPDVTNAARQPAFSMMSWPTKVMAEPPRGKAMLMNPMARPRLVRNQLAAVVRGATPFRKLLATERAMA